MGEMAGKRLLGRPRIRWKDSVVKDLRSTSRKGSVRHGDGVQ